MLTKIRKKLTDVLAQPYYLYHYIRKTSKNFKGQSSNYAIVNFDRNFRLDDFSRYLYALCIYLEKAGFHVVIKTGLPDYKMSVKSGYQKYIWEGDYSFVRNCSSPMNTVVLVQPGTADRVIRFSYGFHVLQLNRFDCVAPFPMHPLQIKYHLAPASSTGFENSNRNIKVLFSGSLLKDRYAGQRMAKFFNHIPRLEVIQFILSQFKGSSRALESKADKETLMQLMNSDAYVNEVILSGVKTDPEDWLKILSKADFFICPPGTKMPWCHNAVEAMSVGAIPILEYGDLFFPALENRKNCLTYKNHEELKEAIEIALAMDASEIAAIRENVSHYYNAYLSVDSIARRIKEIAHSEKKEVRIAVPFVPLPEERHIARAPGKRKKLFG